MLEHVARCWLDYGCHDNAYERLQCHSVLFYVRKVELLMTQECLTKGWCFTQVNLKVSVHIVHNTALVDIVHNTALVDIVHNTALVDIVHNTALVDIVHNAALVDIVHNTALVDIVQEV
ncbi:hypothetical protein Btru_019044 [Bulinus truncatus]|nr:hypothetical protein Btru_019044 [Bulinus truncatus]